MRKRKPPEEDNPLRWLTTYGDVVTLLLAFFVLLYAISQVDQQKFQLFVSGLGAPFGNPAAAQGIIEGPNTLTEPSPGEGPLPADQNVETVDGLGLVDDGADERLPEHEYPTTTSTTTTAATSTTTTTLPFPIDDRVLQTAEDLLDLQEIMRRILLEAGLEEVVDINIDTRGLVVAIATDDVLFRSGSAVISEQGTEILDALAPSLGTFSNEILVEGHTDDIPYTGRFGYDNWSLSTDRAVAVLRRLIEVHEIYPTRLIASGFGEFRPRANNDTEEGRSLNRRVELVIAAETE